MLENFERKENLNEDNSQSSHEENFKPTNNNNNESTATQIRRRGEGSSRERERRKSIDRLVLGLERMSNIFTNHFKENVD